MGLYQIEALGVHGDGRHIRFDNVHIELGTTSIPHYQKRVDVKARINNRGTSQLVVSAVGAALSSATKTWQPIDWRVYWLEKVSTEGAVIAPGSECWLHCSFKVQGRRERFPKNLTVDLGSISLNEKVVNLGSIRLYVSR
jgi:hypothetical protein